MRARDQMDAINWHRRSRVRWLAIGDAPSKLFFAQRREKIASERVRCIRREDGSIVEDKDEILTEVGLYYAEIFMRDLEVQANEAERR